MASYAWQGSMPMVTMVQKPVRQPGIEPGSIAWKATMLTFTPPTLIILVHQTCQINTYWG